MKRIWTFFKRLFTRPERVVVVRNEADINHRMVDCEFRNIKVSDGIVSIHIQEMTLRPGWQLVFEKFER